MKTCKLCTEEKTDDSFYKGHARCKDCYTGIVKKHRGEKKQYYKDYDKGRANLPKRVEARKLYSKTNDGIESGNKAKKKWSELNLIKRSASLIVGNAVRDGKIIKSYICEQCKITGPRIHGHHDDYAFPLSVRWLCSKCHCAWHKENGPGING